mgnify:CR=1 FL=1
MDLSVNINNVKLKTPVISASCVDGKDGSRICAVSEFKLGAAVTKTIVKNMQKDVLPNMKMVKGGSMINCVFGTNLTAEQWFKEEFPIALKAEIPIIANMAAVNPEEAIEMAKACEDAGASMIEYPSACPHMGNVLEAMYPGLKIELPEVSDPTDYARQIEAVKKAVSIPVIAKFSAIYQLDCVRWAKAVESAGADAITAADSIGPVIDIDIESGQPVLGGPKGYGGLTGPAIKPIVLKMVLDISEAVNIPVIGVGGITTAEDAIAYIMAGATAVELATSATINGCERYAKIVDGIEAFMKRKGYNSLEDFRGLTHKKIAERAATGRKIIQNVVLPVQDESKCNGCGSCYRACVYGAIKLDGHKVEFLSDKCAGCGLCASVCPRKAISQDYFE